MIHPRLHCALIFSILLPMLLVSSAMADLHNVLRVERERGFSRHVPYGDVGYFSSGSDMIIMDISDPYHLDTLATVTFESPVKPFRVFDHYLFLTKDTGIAVYDIENAITPEMVAIYEGMHGAQFKFDWPARRIYKISSSEIKVFDISDITTATEVLAYDRAYDPNGYTSKFQEMHPYGDYWYLLLQESTVVEPGDTIREYQYYIYDVSDLNNITRIDTLGDGTIGIPHIHNDYLYIKRVSETEIYSLANPSSPELVHTLDQSSFRIYFNHDAMYVLTQYFSSNYIYMYDIQDPSNPVLLGDCINEYFTCSGSHSLGTYNSNIEGVILAGDHLYYLNSETGIDKIYHYPGQFRYFCKYQDKIYFHTDNKLGIMDVSNMDNPEVICETEIGCSYTDMLIVNGYLITMNMLSLQYKIICSYSIEGDTFQLMDQKSLYYDWGFTKKENYLYFPRNYEASVIRVSDDGLLETLGEECENIEGYSIARWGDWMITMGHHCLYFYSIKYPDNPQLYYTWDSVVFADHELVALKGQACLAIQDWYPPHCVFVDISDRSNPAILGECERYYGFRGWHTWINNTMVTRGQGLVFYTFDDPMNPEVIGPFNPPAIFWMAQWDGEYLWTISSYHLDAWDISEEVSVSEPMSEAPVNDFHIRSTYPNPFNSAVRIVVDVPADEVLEMRVYDVLGRQVAREVVLAAAGSKTLVWNGLDKTGAHVASGTYFVKVRGRDAVLSRKVVLLR